MAKKHKCPEHVNHERWLVSYADFITLLFAFFTVLYAISNTDAKKVKKFVGSAERAFSVAVFPSGSDTLMMGDPNVTAGDQYDMGIKMMDVEQNLKSSMAGETKDGKVAIEKVEGGLLITLKTFGFFESGSEQLHPGAQDTIQKIGQELKRIPNEIRVDGHTDNTPIHSGRFNSNWELSSARAVAVLQGLLSTGIDPVRFSVSGFAEFRPLTSNNSTEGRAKNRRVEIFVIEKNEKVIKNDQPEERFLLMPPIKIEDGVKDGKSE